MTHDEIETFCKEQTQRLRDMGYPEAWVGFEFNAYCSGEWIGNIHFDKYGSKYDPVCLEGNEGVDGAVRAVRDHISNVDGPTNLMRNILRRDIEAIKDRAERVGIEIIAEIK